MRRLTTEAVLDGLGYKSPQTLRDMIKSGEFPPPIKDGNLNFWPEQDLIDYLQRFAERRGKSGGNEQPKRQRGQRGKFARSDTPAAQMDQQRGAGRGGEKAA